MKLFYFLILLVLTSLLIRCDNRSDQEGQFFSDFSSLMDSITKDTVVQYAKDNIAIKLHWLPGRYGSLAYIVNNNWLTFKNRQILYFKDIGSTERKVLFDFNRDNPELIESFFDPNLNDTVFRFLKPLFSELSVADSLNAGVLLGLKKGILGVCIVDQTDYIKKYYGKGIVHSIIGNLYPQPFFYEAYFIVHKDTEWPRQKDQVSVK